MHTFNYNGVTIYSNELELEELGQVCIEATDNTGLCYYLIIRTSLGQSSILEYGPLATGIKLLPVETSIKFQRVEFSLAKLNKTIRKFLAPRNRGQNVVVNVRTLSIDEAIGLGVNLLEYIKNFNDTTSY